MRRGPPTASEHHTWFATVACDGLRDHPVVPEGVEIAPRHSVVWVATGEERVIGEAFAKVRDKGGDTCVQERLVAFGPPRRGCRIGEVDEPPGSAISRERTGHLGRPAVRIECQEARHSRLGGKRASGIEVGQFP